MSKIYWGVSGFSHDASISVISNNSLLFASSSERYSRIKNDKNLNFELINDCLQYGPPDEVVWYENPYNRFLRVFLKDKNLYNPFIKPKIRKFIDKTKITFSNHHFSHLATSLYTSPFDVKNSLGVVVDTVGELSTITIYNIKDLKKQNIIYTQYYPDSLGLFYSSITQLVGLKPQEDEYILMGMASFGKTDKYYNYFLENFFDNGSLKIDLRRGCRKLLKKNIIERDKFEIAHGAQKVFETILLNLIKKYLKNTGYKKIIMSGGCALNCTFNSKLLDLVENMWIFPNPGDSGSAIGAALSKIKEPVYFENLFLGHDSNNYPNINKVVDEIIKNNLVGVINGRAEFGPRALGNRSILADPRIKNIKNIVNSIKGRENFRPFAPAILKEHFNDYFLNNSTSCYFPYMQYTFKSKYAKEFPGIVHIDDTSRVQTVDETTPFLYNVLKKWYSLTKCPMLLNTSLNIKGKPLLNKREDIVEFSNKNFKIY